MRVQLDNAGNGQSDRERVCSILTAQIETIAERIDDSDPDDLDEERMLIRWTRTLGYLSGQYRKLLQDEDLDELEADLELLQAATERVGDE